MLSISLLAALLGPARAQEPPPPDDGGELTEEELAAPPPEGDRLFDTPGVEIIVVDDRLIQQARQEVEDRLLDLGYERARRRDGKVEYRHPVNYKPRVIVDDDGYVIVRRQPPRVAAPELGGPMEDVPVMKWLPCVIIPTLCVRMGGWTITPRRYAHHKQAAIEAVEEPLRAYGDALAARALQERIGQELPAQLDAIWYEGRHPDRPEPLTTYAQRRAAILELWMNRADNEYGDAVREAIELYMAYEVNVSLHPFTAEELARANAERTCQRELALPVTGW